jgi:hypothetical protein
MCRRERPRRSTTAEFNEAETPSEVLFVSSVPCTGMSALCSFVWLGGTGNDLALVHKSPIPHHRPPVILQAVSAAELMA